MPGELKEECRPMNSEQTQLDSKSANPSSASGASVDHFVQQKYKHGFVTDIESETVPPGLDEDVVRWISARKDEPQWLLDWRLEAYRHWLKMTPPDWAHLNIDPIDFQAISQLLKQKHR